MSYIIISNAAEILGVNKKTLFRWDQEDRFKPAKREEVSKIRLYDEKDVQNLKFVLDHEKLFKENMKKWREVQAKLTNYMTIFLMSDKEIELQNESEKLYKIHRELVDKFMAYPQEIKLMHRKFFKI